MKATIPNQKQGLEMTTRRKSNAACLFLPVLVVAIFAWPSCSFAQDSDIDVFHGNPNVVELDAATNSFSITNNATSTTSMQVFVGDGNGNFLNIGNNIVIAGATKSITIPAGTPRPVTVIIMANGKKGRAKGELTTFDK